MQPCALPLANPAPKIPSRPSLLFFVLALASAILTLSAPVVAQTWSQLGLDGVTLSAIAVHPEDPEILFAGGGPEDGSGMYRSLDGGNSWTPINVGLGTVHRVNVIAFDAAAIESGAEIPVLIGVLKLGGPNLFRSEDLGDSWQAATLGLPNSLDEVTALAFDPTTAGVGYAGLNGSAGGVSKTSNSGLAWSDASTGLADAFCSLGCVLDLVIDPTTPSTLFTAMPVLGSVYKSTTSGDSWSPTTADLWPEELVISPSDPQRLYSSGTVPGEGGVQRTDNGGTAWTDLTFQPGLPQPANVVSHRAMALDPEDPSEVWIVAEDVFAPGQPLEAVYHSQDSGASWALTDDGLEGVRVQQFVYAGPWLLAATDDGVYRTFQGLFADGFESGNLIAWSATVP